MSKLGNRMIQFAREAHAYASGAEAAGFEV